MRRFLPVESLAAPRRTPRSGAKGAQGGQIAAVRQGGPAWKAGIKQGDQLVAVDGVVPRDLIDLQDQAQGRLKLSVDVAREGTHVSLTLTTVGDGDLGLEFDEPTFDGLRECNNNCEFCFIRGLPKGLRRSLYVRDDDYRYSFLFGSFVTLTNLTELDWQRITYQRLSPLRVSIHATDPDVRARMLAHPGTAPILPQLRRLGAAGVQVHGQIVLCPGINDGEVLSRTLVDLTGIEQVVQSVAVVPVGISEHLPVRRIRPVRVDEAREAVGRAMEVHRRERRRLGRGLVYPSDELFLLAGLPLPGERFYDGFPQMQNGVGLVRVLVADWRRHRRRLPARLSQPRRVAWLCGRAAYPALMQMAEDANRVEGLRVEVRAVESTLFGTAISVSGLMSGLDATNTLQDMTVDLAVLPRSAFGHAGERTLDDWSVEDIAEVSRVGIRLGGTASELVAATVT